MNGRILIVDDEPNIRLTLRLCLEAEGYTVEEAGDGQEALEKVLANPPELVLLDLALPKLSGTEVFEKLQEAGNTTPVVLMTAHGLTLAIRALFLGASGFLEKPVSPECVRDAVARHLVDERPRASAKRPPPALWPVQPPHSIAS
jgi:DNA-binding response OmpR family regulator